jgi:hypothetical protein
MLTHIVCFKYKAAVGESERLDHRTRLAGLAGLAGVIDLKVGSDVVGSPRSYDTGLIVTFTDRRALDAYAADPQHVPVAQSGAALCEHIVAVDFE